MDLINYNLKNRDKALKVFLNKIKCKNRFVEEVLMMRNDTFTLFELKVVDFFKEELINFDDKFLTNILITILHSLDYSGIKLSFSNIPKVIGKYKKL